MTGREIIDTLERFLVLEWFRYGALKDVDQHKFPPIIVWRYDAESMGADEIKMAEGRIATAVDCFQGNVSWELYFSGKNWVLLPKRVKDLEDTGEYRNDMDVLTMLADTEPSFGLMANSDLLELSKCIEVHLSQRDKVRI